MGMYRDIEINFSELDEIARNLYLNRAGIEDFIKQIEMIKKEIKNINKGKAIEEYVKECEETIKNLEKQKEQMEEYENLFKEYIIAMESANKPISREANSRVDRNNIYFEVDKIIQTINGNFMSIGLRKKIEIAFKNTTSEWLIKKEDREEAKNRGIRMEGIRENIMYYMDKMEEVVNNIWRLHEVEVKNYENLDDEYAEKMQKLYTKNTNIGEGIGTALGGVAEGFIKMFQGVGDSLGDLGQGIFDVATGAISYVIAGVSYIFEEDKEGSWQKVILDGTHEQVTYMVTNIDEVLCSLAYGIDDAIQHKGLNYSIGYVAGDLMAEYVTAGTISGATAGKWVSKVDDVSGASKVVSKVLNKIDNLPIIDGKVLGKIPIEDFLEIRKKSIHYPDSDKLTLGKYRPSIDADGIENWGVPGKDSYNSIGKNQQTTYFDLGKDWDAIKDKYSLSDTEMFEIFNVPALDDAIAAGKQIEFTHNPLDPKYAGQFIEDEWKYIKEKLNLTDADLIEKDGKWYVNK